MCFFLSVSIFMWTCHLLLNCVKTLLRYFSFFTFPPYSTQLLCLLVPVQSLRALGFCRVPLLSSHFTCRFPLYLSLLALRYFLKSTFCSQKPPAPAYPWCIWLGCLLLSKIFFLISSKKQLLEAMLAGVRICCLFCCQSAVLFWASHFLLDAFCLLPFEDLDKKYKVGGRMLSFFLLWI